MHVIKVRNVTEALPAAIQYLFAEGSLRETRAGPALTAPGPVTTLYTHPRERVLFSAVRDANPAFHLLEALWLLAGRNDTAYLDVYVKDFGERFAEPGTGILAGSYGRRWRQDFGFDQLSYIVGQLRNDPGSRQAVLQMWDCTNDNHGLGMNDLKGNWKDRPCNTQAYFRLRRGELDITVTCRSNDAIMGAYGANAVQFSILQEYMAARIGVQVGQYWQVSNDLHAYATDIERLMWRAKITSNPPQFNNPHQSEVGIAISAQIKDNRYNKGIVRPTRLVDTPEVFDLELSRLMQELDLLHNKGLYGIVGPPDFSNKFLRTTAWPVAVAHWLFKNENVAEALAYAEDNIMASDWRVAIVEWLQRRVK